eukprot:7105558-Prorocentrum_lima.AAC.1
MVSAEGLGRRGGVRTIQGMCCIERVCNSKQGMCPSEAMVDPGGLPSETFGSLLRSSPARRRTMLLSTITYHSTQEGES